MKRTSLFISLGALLCLATSPMSRAQTVPNSILFTPNVDLSAGPQNGFVGTVGGIFLTSYSYYPQVNWLGYYDQNGDGLANSHVVTLWEHSTQTIMASATVPAGTAAPLVDGYRWVPLSSTVTLNYGSYYVIGAHTDGIDNWGIPLPTMGVRGRLPGALNMCSWVPAGNSLGQGDMTRKEIIQVSHRIKVDPIRFTRSPTWGST